jgi:hypothetical protein
MAKKKNINKKISKNICECIFDKNKELSIIDNNNIVNSENSYDELLKLSHLFKKRI